MPCKQGINPKQVEYSCTYEKSSKHDAYICLIAIMTPFGLPYNLYYLAYFFSRNSIFLSQQFSQNSVF